MSEEKPSQNQPQDKIYESVGGLSGIRPQSSQASNQQNQSSNAGNKENK